MSQMKINVCAITMTARQLTLEEQIQCQRLRDGGHSTAEYHDSVSMFLCVLNNMFRDVHEKNGVIRANLIDCQSLKHSRFIDCTDMYRSVSQVAI